MCPACLASTVLITGTIASIGGATALLAKVLRTKKREKEETKPKER